MAQVASFDVRWQINDDEWSKAQTARQNNAPSSDYDDSLTPLYDLLYGAIQFQSGGVGLFPDWHDAGRGIKVSILDMAQELAQTIFVERFADAPDGAAASFVELEFRVGVKFEKRQNDVVITTDLPEGHTLTVPQDVFMQGARTFLTDFVAQIRARAPQVLDWESVAALRGF